MEISSPKIKKSFIFSQKKKKKCFSFILGNRTFQEMELSGFIFFLYFMKEFSELKKLKKPTLQKLLYFGKWNFLASSLKHFLVFQEGTCKA